jgi:hypothetical protein
VYETSSVDAAVTSLNAPVRDAAEQAIPRGCTHKSGFPPSFSNTLKYYTVKKHYFHRYFKKKRSDCLYDKFALSRKLVKNTITSDRLRWLKSIDYDLSHNRHTSRNTYLISENRDPVSFSFSLMVHT